MKEKVLQILAETPHFTTETCSGVGYHGSSKGEEYNFTVYKYRGESFFNMEDLKIAFVMDRLEPEIKEIVKQLK